MNNLLTILIILVAGLYFAYFRSLRYLHYFQQETYNAKRFWKWGLNNKAFDKKGSLIAFLAALSTYIIGNNLLLTIIGGLTLLIITRLEEDPRHYGKLRLQMTERAKTLHRTTLAIYGTFTILGGIVFTSTSFIWIYQIFLFQSIPGMLVLANRLLDPGEQRKQQRFLTEAKTILKKTSPYVVGITGSYGKTSTKDALGQILQVTLGPTFWPSKGVNTPMGITREIRSHLQSGHQYAVIEMAAYGRGSIQRLCALTPPHAAIITSIGTAHLERFGDQHNILLAKSELAQAVPQDGILVCNGDDQGARQIARDHLKKTTLLYGFHQNANLDCCVTSWKTTSKGTEFTLTWAGKTYQGITSLFGKTALSNAVGAFTMACALGSNPEYALAVICNLIPINNRLQVQSGPITYVHDAYNSNPTGFSAALNVTAALPGLRRIVITPGMIELGPKQHEENAQIGRMAAQVCDLAIVVGQTNREALIHGLKSGGLKEAQILTFATRDQALNQLALLQRDGDIILIENDLPDLYEATPIF